MNRIKKCFETLKEKKEKALVGFVTGGDPDFDRSFEIIRALCEGGIDILELGIPFSDPTSDGPVIQRSSARALKSGMNLAKVLEMTGKIREITEIPIILFSYYNPIFKYGNEKFYEHAIKAGADGVLVVDLPPEESDEMTSFRKNGNFDLIRLVAPTTPPERMKKIADGASGFLYLVSKTGVTGSSGLDTSETAVHAKALRNITNLPICIGFGISTPTQVGQVAKIADGVVIGSAFEKLIEENLENQDLFSMMTKKTKKYKNATLNVS